MLLKQFPLSIDHVLNQAKMTLNDIDYCNLSSSKLKELLNMFIKNINVQVKSFYMNLQEYGNTSAASIPLALAKMNEQGLLQKGMKIILVGFGGGLTWGAILNGMVRRTK